MNVKPLTENSSSSGPLEHTTSKNPSWDDQVAQEAKELREITNIHNNEPEENNTYLTKEKNPYLEEVNNEALLTNQDDKDSIRDEAEFEATTNEEMNNETTTNTEENIETTTRKGPMNEQNNSILEKISIFSFSRFSEPLTRK